MRCYAAAPLRRCAAAPLRAPLQRCAAALAHYAAGLLCPRLPVLLFAQVGISDPSKCARLPARPHALMRRCAGTFVHLCAFA
mmetsp:Transcript_55946/g.121777  ORF Transcript_55946/g.121777 Transcript_55946/m.121777 type:complete len:82 (+) Transcript_55946:262-507(+)